MREFKINKNTAFKVTVEDVEEFNDSFFRETYLKAAEALKYILDRNVRDEIEEDDDISNNIISFVGERGAGKTSVMKSFAKSLKLGESGLMKIEEQYCERRVDNISKTDFKELYNDIYKLKFHVEKTIDPSIFSGKETIIEILIAQMFSNFTKQINKSTCKSSFSEKQCLIRCFENIYKDLRVLNRDKSKIYDENEDNLDILNSLSSAVSLKENFKILIDKYLLFVDKNVLVICIDDIDMKHDGAADMIEDIRKYLIVENVVILMAVKIEQLNEIIKQKNIEAFNTLIKYNNYQNRDSNAFIKDEINSKAEKYLEKIIPATRRLYLPILKESDVTLHIEDFLNNSIKEKYNSGDLRRIIQLQLKDKLDFLIIMDEANEFLIPNNLRGVVDLLVLLFNMKDCYVNNKLNSIILKNNISQFTSYILQIFNNGVSNEKHKQFITELLNINSARVNQKIIGYLGNLILESYSAYKENPNNKISKYIKMCCSEEVNYKNLSIGHMNQIIEIYRKGAKTEEEKLFAWIIRILYTLIMYKEYKCNKELSIIQQIIAGDIYGYCIGMQDSPNFEKITKRIKSQFDQGNKIEILDEYKNPINNIEFNYYLKFDALNCTLTRNYDERNNYNYNNFVFEKGTSYINNDEYINIKNSISKEGVSTYTYYTFNPLYLINMYIYITDDLNLLNDLELMKIKEIQYVLLNLLINQDLLSRIIENIEISLDKKTSLQFKSLDTFNLPSEAIKKVLGNYPEYKNGSIYNMVKNIEDVNREIVPFIDVNIRQSEKEKTVFYIGKEDNSKYGGFNLEEVERVNLFIEKTLYYLNESKLKSTLGKSISTRLNSQFKNEYSNLKNIIAKETLSQMWKEKINPLRLQLRNLDDDSRGRNEVIESIMKELLEFMRTINTGVNK